MHPGSEAERRVGEVLKGRNTVLDPVLRTRVREMCERQVLRAGRKGAFMDDATVIAALYLLVDEAMSAEPAPKPRPRRRRSGGSDGTATPQ